MAEIGLPETLAADIAVGLYRRGEVAFGDFALRDGSWSPIYVDLRPTASAIEDNPRAPTMSRADQLRFRGRVIEAYSYMLDGLNGQYEHIQAVPEAVCGIAPMIGFARDDSVLHRRIKTKTHGVPSEILGDYGEGDRTVFIDDLISSSGAKVDEKHLVEDISRPRDRDGTVKGTGLVVARALILLNRETGGIEAAAKAGLIVDAGVTLSYTVEANHAEGLMSDRQYNIATAYMRGDLRRQEDIHLFV